MAEERRMDEDAEKLRDIAGRLAIWHPSSPAAAEVRAIAARLDALTAQLGEREAALAEAHRMLVRIDDGLNRSGWEEGENDREWGDALDDYLFNVGLCSATPEHEAARQALQPGPAQPAAPQCPHGWIRVRGKTCPRCAQPAAPEERDENRG